MARAETDGLETDHYARGSEQKGLKRKMASNFILLDDQVVTALVSYVDDEGNPAVAPVGVTPAWSSVDPDGTLSLAPSADGSSCMIKATGKLTVTQAAQITVMVARLAESCRSR